MFYRKTFSNGLRFVFSPLKGQTATILVMVRAGSRYETTDNNGISHFLEHLFFKGSRKWPSAQRLSQELDKIGANYNAFTGKEVTGFYIKAASSYFPVILEVISDMLLNPLFAQKEIDKERGVILEEMKMVQDTPMHYVGDLFEKLLYGKSSLGQLIIGKEENIKKLSRSDFFAYYTHRYIPQNVVVSVAGNLKKKEAEKGIKKHFSWLEKKEDRDNLPSFNFNSGPQVLLFPKKTDQIHLALGAPAFGLTDKRRFALKVLAVILGGNMSSRLFTEIREKRGLAYYIRAFYEPYVDTGYLVVQAGLNFNKIEEGIKLILKEFFALARRKVGKDELKRAKEFIKGTTAIGLETSHDIASFLGAQEVLLGKIMTPQEQFARIDAVTREDIKKIAQEIFIKEKLFLAMIGDFPQKEKGRFLDILKK